MLNRLALFIASGFYSGFSPKAPGTAGTVLIFILWNLAFYYFGLPIELVTCLCILILIFGLIATALVLKTTNNKDPQFVVVDEWSGFSFGLLAISSSENFFTASIFVLLFFRLFDILKPFPIKKIERLPGAWGVMLDDVVAGLYTLIAYISFNIISNGAI